MDIPGPLFTGFQSDFGRLDAMIDGISDKVKDGIAESVDHGLVDLRVLSKKGKLYFLALLLRQVPDHPREPLEYVADGEHPDPHDRILKFGCGFLDHLGHSRQIAEKLLSSDKFFNIPGDLVELRLVDDKLTGQIQEVIKALKINSENIRFHRPGDSRRRRPVVEL